MAQHQGSVVGAAIWMFVLSVLLFWLPMLGPLLAGFVGGRKAGNTGTAVMAALLPALIMAGLTMMFSTMLLGMPVLGILAGLGTFAFALIHVLPLLAGAVIGGATA